MDASFEHPIQRSEEIFGCYAKMLLERSLIDFTTRMPVSEPKPLNASIDVSPLTSDTPEATKELSERLVEKLLDSDLASTTSLESNQASDEPSTQPVDSIAIIGAGVAGLYAAMLLADFGWHVDIIEASDRIGGRLYTHTFNNSDGSPAGKWDYFDVGAMRFPDTPVMQRTFNLFKIVDVPTLEYHISEENNWKAYNEVRLRVKDVKTAGLDPFKVASAPGRPGLPKYWAEQDPSELLRQAINPFLQALAKNYKVALNNIIKYFDHYSTRSYLATFWKYPPKVINWIETMSFGTGWFDRGLIETILEELAFSFNRESPSDLKWRCVEGGSRVIPERMETWLTIHAEKTRIKRKHRVTAVKFDGNRFELFGNNRSNPIGDSVSFGRTYSHVIFAVPPPCIRMIDVSTCRLDFNQRNALRELQLAPSSKIGIKFKTAWWTRLQGITGGQSTTDRVCRTIVYPSQGDGKSTVLIASYSWTQDSLALGAFMHGPDSPELARLQKLMLADLAYIHDVDPEMVEGEFEEMYAFDWSYNALSTGAFGLFGPSQFKHVYPAVTRTAANGQMHFIGETFSTTHGWVAGALESAERAVFQMLSLHKYALMKMPNEEFEKEKKTMPRNGRVADGKPQKSAPLPEKEPKAAKPISDPVAYYKEKWDPELMVDDETLFNQVLKSWILQKAEFDDEGGN